MSADDKKKAKGKLMTIRLYQDLTTAYLNTESISQSAREVGISISSATLYINEGTAKFPAIKDRVAAIKQKSMREYDVGAVREMRVIKSGQENMLAKVLQTLGRIQLEPRGEYVLDETGQIVRNERGEPLIQVTEATFKTMVNMVAKLESLGKTVRKSQAENTPGTVTAEVVSSSAPPSIQMTNEQLARKGVNLAAITRAGQESGIVKALTDEISVRSRAENR